MTEIDRLAKLNFYCSLEKCSDCFSFSFSFSCGFSSPYSGAMTYVAQYMMQASLLQRNLRTPFVF